MQCNSADSIHDEDTPREGETSLGLVAKGSGFGTTLCPRGTSHHSRRGRHNSGEGFCHALRQCFVMILAGLRTVHDNCKLLEEQGGISMFRKLVIGALGAMAVLFSTTAF